MVECLRLEHKDVGLNPYVTGLDGGKTPAL